MTTVNIDDLVTRLHTHHASLGDGRDCRSQNERAEWHARSTTAARVYSELRNVPSDLAREQATLDGLEASRAVTVAKQGALEQEIAAAPDWRLMEDARARDDEYDRQRHLRRQLEHLHAGTLLQSPGECYLPLDHLDRRIAEVTDRRDRLQRQLDGAIAQAEQLLSAASVTS